MSDQNPNKPLVLFVEDADYLAELGSHILERIGIEVIICLTAEFAIDFMEKNRLPDLIVLDIGMPGMTGWEFLDIIKKYQETKTIPIVVTTAYGDATNRLIGRLRDVDRYIVKPYKPEELQMVVRQILQL
ncbi:MAG TPA: response regulator [Aggregatilineales bacterium]|nr:response regulator [Aggregatilineales bacterium]